MKYKLIGLIIGICASLHAQQIDTHWIPIENDTIRLSLCYSNTSFEKVVIIILDSGKND